MNELDYELSVHVAGLIDAQEYRCWYNACKAIMQLPGLFLFASYTEGWLVVPKEEIQVIEHGWVSLPWGRIVDPSIVLLEEKGQEMFYFPALHFSWSQVQALPKGVLFPLAHLISPTDHELGDPDYRAAYDRALEYAESLAATSGKRVQICPKETIVTVVTEQGTIVIIV